MDPRKNPFAPGAGSPPPELAGRDEIIERAAIALDRICNGRPSRSVILYGLRGVGKTVLLNRIRSEADGRGLVSVPIETPESRSLPAILIPALRAALIRLSLTDAAKHMMLRIISGFSKALKVKYGDIEASLDLEPMLGVADSGDLEFDLIELFKTVGRAVKDKGTALVLYIDELQYVQENQLEALITALHSVAQDQLPLTMVAAGLPQLLAQMGQAKSYAERLFDFVEIGPLESVAATKALRLPVQHEGAELADEALGFILDQTKGYPYFLQEWGKHCWDVAQSSPIQKADAEKATQIALAELDASFFRVRFDRLTPSEKQYMFAMAELGNGPHRSGDIADRLGKTAAQVSMTRSKIMKKGMIYSPAHGDTAFTVPLFDGFMKRIMAPVSE